MFNSLVEKLLPKTEEFPKIQAPKLSQKQIADKPSTDIALEELKKALNFIEMEPMLDLPKSYVSTLRGHKSALPLQ
ncbi:hypothetical protein SteCoe_40143 [Stentor coeruleus]|uniref:Uncharacterized protein n=1 Tax=Stentor coeruleus TaxID=5963 RepID=A0A1R2AKI1_9CILI|nr:hypothetical protein SteCoe_40143 [Stentor coeruleus]